MLARPPATISVSHLQWPADAVIGHHHLRRILRLTFGHVATRAIESRAIVHGRVATAADRPVFRRRLGKAVRRMTRGARELAGRIPIAARFQQPVTRAVQFELLVVGGCGSVGGIRSANFQMALEACRLAGLARSGGCMATRAAERARTIALLAGMANQAFRREAEAGAGGVLPAV